MNPSRTVAVVTTSRADFSHLYWPLRRLADVPGLQTKIIAAAAHLSSEFGETVIEIEKAGFRVDERVECLLSSDTDLGMAKTIGVAMLGFSDVLDRLRPDVLLLIADRYEILAPASAALALRVPIAHVEGGDVSEGAIDDTVRNALTKMSHLHFTPTAQARRRVIAMGEESWRVHHVGAPSLDHLVHSTLPERPELEKLLDLRLSGDLCVVAWHPTTILPDTLGETDALFDVLEKLERQIVFCFPNADAGSREIVERARSFCDRRSDADVFVNIPAEQYWSLLASASLMIGNSSSGIMEAPSLKVPVVNVGCRQDGRQRAANIVDAEAKTESILEAVERVDCETFRAALQGLVSPYGDGHAGERIAAVLSDLPPREVLLRKRALPLRDDDVAFEQAPGQNTLAVLLCKAMND